jgi:hypothetical protein
MEERDLFNTLVRVDSNALYKEEFTVSSQTLHILMDGILNFSERGGKPFENACNKW